MKNQTQPRVSFAHRVEEEANAGRVALAGFLAHDLGNIANNIHLHAQLLERKLRKSEVKDEGDSVGLVLRGATRLNEFVTKLRSVPGSSKETAASCCIADTAQYAKGRMAPLATATGVDIELAVSGKIFNVKGYRALLDHVAVELCRNAIAAMPEGGTLTLSVDGTSSNVCLTVSDTGAGQPKEVDAFAPFAPTRLDQSGQGMAVAQYIAVAHHGFIKASDNEPHGSTFALILPT